MACAAIPPYETHDRVFYPVRGQCISAYISCPGCGSVLQAHRLTQTSGIKRCHVCNTTILIGIVAFVLPTGPHIMPSDYALPDGDKPLNAARRRTRKRRAVVLKSLGLGDTLPEIALQRYVAGQAINRVVVVPPPEAPESEPEPRT